MDFNNIPIGFGFALARNEKALAAYAVMTEAQKQTVLSQAHNARSKEEMNRIVSGIENGNI